MDLSIGFTGSDIPVSDQLNIVDNSLNGEYGPYQPDNAHIPTVSYVPPPKPQITVTSLKVEPVPAGGQSELVVDLSSGSSAAPPPTGTLNVTADGAVIGSAQVTASTGTSVTIPITVPDTAGEKVLAVSFVPAPGSGYSPVTAAAGPTVSLLVLRPTTTTLASPQPKRVRRHRRVTFDALVQCQDDPGTPFPTGGTVAFQDTDDCGRVRTLATVPVDTGNGTASFTTRDLWPGRHQVTAIYTPDSLDAGSQSAPPQEKIILEPRRREDRFDRDRGDRFDPDGDDRFDPDSGGRADRDSGAGKP